MCANRCWGDDIIALSELLPEMDADDVEMLALKLRKAGWKSPSLQAPTMVFNITPAGLDAEAVASVALENIDYAMRRG